MQDVTILGIETSCDETSAAVVQNGSRVLSNVISSQIDIHKMYGGVVPEIASRKHVEMIIPVIDEAIRESGLKLGEMDAIAVTYGPGLVGALLVGLSAAKALAFTIDKPLIGIHHIEGHIAANYIDHLSLKPPFICLIVSGGHSHVVHIKDYDDFEILGQTRDDAAGEAFDKIARAVGLGYPGGPLIDIASKTGNPEKYKFPRVSFGKTSMDFSFSGLKTAALNQLNGMSQRGEAYKVDDIAASFQQAIVDVLVNHTLMAAKLKKLDTIAIAGGVAANSLLRAQMSESAAKVGIKVYYPRPILCTDNAAMIAAAGYFEFVRGHRSDLTLNAIPGLKLGQR